MYDIVTQLSISVIADKRHHSSARAQHCTLQNLNNNNKTSR
jgi:hypothetical protein